MVYRDNSPYSHKRMDGVFILVSGFEAIFCFILTCCLLAFHLTSYNRKNTQTGDCAFSNFSISVVFASYFMCSAAFFMLLASRASLLILRQRGLYHLIELA